MQRRIADRDATDEYRLESRYRCERAGSTDLELDRAQRRQSLLGRKLMGHAPARCARDESQLALQCQAIDFVDDTIDLVRQRRSSSRHVVKIFEAAVSTMHLLHLGRHAQAPVTQHLEHLGVRLWHLRPLEHTERIEKHFERTRGRDGRIELSKAASGGIAGIDEHLLAARHRLGIQPLETAVRDENLAAYLEERRRSPSQA